MSSTSSARRRPEPPAAGGGLGAILPFVLLAAGALLIGLALWTEFSGDVVMSQTVSPTPSEDGTLYTAKTVDLAAGEYGLSLRLSRIRVLLSVNGIGYTVTAPEHPGWSERGRLKLSERQRSSRDDAFRSTVIDIPADGPCTLTVTVGADVDRDLRIRLRTVEADFRIPMALGLALLVAGFAMHRPLRDRLLALSRRD